VRIQLYQPVTALGHRTVSLGQVAEWPNMLRLPVKGDWITLIESDYEVAQVMLYPTSMVPPYASLSMVEEVVANNEFDTVVDELKQLGWKE
jgi:hypothetical protein